MSRILWAQSVGSIEMQSVENDDKSVTIEARITLVGKTTMNAVDYPSSYPDDEIVTHTLMAFITKIRNEMQAILDTSAERKRP